MMLTFSLDPSALNDRTGFQSDPDYLRGCEYYTLGEYRQSVIYFELVREKLAENPGASYAFLDEMTETEGVDSFGVAEITEENLVYSVLFFDFVYALTL